MSDHDPNDPAYSEAARATAMRALLEELLRYEREAFEADQPVEGAALVDWFGAFRETVKSAIGPGPFTSFLVVHGSPLDGLMIDGPFADADVAGAWAEVECEKSDGWWITELVAPIDGISGEIRDSPAHRSGKRRC